MTGKSHLCYGIAAGVSAAVYLETKSVAVGLGVICATIIGNLFPDIDNNKSLIGSKIKIISTITNKFFGHRGFLHSPMLAALIFFLLSRRLQGEIIYIGQSFVFGLIGHLLLDSLTTGGIPLMYPFSRKRFRILKIKTGSKIEPIVLTIAISLLAISTMLAKIVT